MNQERSIALRLRANFTEFDQAFDQSAARVDKLAQALEASSKKVEEARARHQASAQQIVAAEKRLEQAQNASNSSAQKVQKAQTEVANAKKAHQAATEALTNAERQHQQVVNQSTTALGKLAQQAEVNAEAWSTASNVLMAAGAATLALGTAAIKVGIDYNTLQQSSRAAMKTLLGGAEAANAQMDKLDQFARTSPFAKQVFISAQQQMIAFGIETRKVIPYMSALNDAAAAAGGTGQTLAEIAFVMSQISAAGKITGMDLIQFGQRGVNAAELIGSQMGKTGAEIREAITAGTLGADEALDALAAGMAETYGGAAANVKQTWIGATDRVKSAWRDLSSAMAEPLVGKEGGGLLIDWANRLADGMRTVEKATKSANPTVMLAVEGITAVTGASALAAGGLMKFVPWLIKTHGAVSTLLSGLPRLAAVLRVVGIAAGGALGAALAVGVGAFALWSKATADAEERASQFADTLEVVEGKVSTTSDTLSLINSRILETKTGLFGMGDSMTGIMARVGVSAKEMSDAINNVPGALDALREKQQAYWNDIESKMSPAQMAFAGSSIDLIHFVEQQADALETAREKAGAKADMDREAGVATDDAADSAKEHAAALQKEAEAAREAERKLRGLEEALWSQANAAMKLKGDEIGWQQAIDDSADSVEKLVKATKKKSDLQKIDTQAGRDAARILRDLYSAGQARIQGMVEEGKSAKEIAGKTADVRSEYIKTARQLGYTKDEAKAMADEMNLIPSKIVTEVAASGVRETQGGLDTLLETIRELPKESQTEIVSKFLDKGLREAEKALKKIDGKTYTTYIKTVTTNSVNAAREASGRGQQRAGGGAIWGPGTETSDSIPIMASTGEHVWSAREVRGAGGHGAVERMRAAARDGRLPQLAQFALKLAAGGPVMPAHQGKPLDYWSDKLLSDLEMVQLKIQIRDLKADLAEREKVRKGKKVVGSRYVLRGLDRTEAQMQLRDAEKELKLARAAAALDKSAKGTIAQQLADYERQQTEAEAAAGRESLAGQLATDLRRGTLASQVRGGQGLSVVDEMLRWSANTDLSEASRSSLAKSAAAAETRITALYGQLETANSTVSQLQATYDQVKGALSGGSALADLAKSTWQQHSDARGNTWYTEQKATGASMAAAARAEADRMLAVAERISLLQQAGASPLFLAKLVQLAGADPDAAIDVADAFLADRGSLASINQAYSDLDSYAGRAAQYVTEASYDGGLAAGKALVDRLLAEADQIGVSLAEAFAAALGMKIDGTTLTKRASGGPTAAGVPYLVGENGPEVRVDAASGWILNHAQAQAAVRAWQQPGRAQVASQQITTYNFGGLTYQARDLTPRQRDALDTVMDLWSNGERRAQAGV